LNVLVRIGDKNFISDYWGDAKGYSSIILDCCDAIETLNDYYFFDLSTKQDLGLWKEFCKNLSNELLSGLIIISSKIDVFKNYNKSPKDLLQDKDWIEIMNLSNIYSKMMEIELGVEKSKEYLI
jgi:hypothetical protein